jgi:glycine/D-amino acid oxidase-like deaminating enzyme
MSLPRSADMVICGAGIAGISTGYFATERLDGGTVVLCDPRPPLTLTSDKSTECYRNWWPNPPMVALMNRSISLLDDLAAESDNAFRLNRRGYLYVTADPERLQQMVTAATATSAAGGGPVRMHRNGPHGPPYVPVAPEGWRSATDGADLMVGSVHDQFPYLTEAAVGAVHVRTAGWFSAQQLGTWMLERARRRGLVFAPSAVVNVEVADNAVGAVVLDNGARITTETVVNASGPLLSDVAALMGSELPVHSELHLKVAFKDTRGVVPREAPMLIWSDPQRIDWSDEERRLLAEQGRTDLLGQMPAACHGRPEGGADSPWVLALWEYTTDVRLPTWPIPRDPLYAEVVLRGMAAMIPDLGQYRDRLPETVVDGGYYTKTVENRPLVGPTDVTGSYVVGALSGFGLMAACGVGELAALHATGGPLPDYASAFSLERYDDPKYLEEIASLGEVGQL